MNDIIEEQKKVKFILFCKLNKSINKKIKL